MPGKMTEKLILAIVGYIADRGGLVSKTKLLKLLYLCEVEFFRLYRQRLTKLDWKFHHLGPWARAYDAVLDGLVTAKQLVEVPMQDYEYDSTLYRVMIPEVKLRDLFDTPKEAFTLEHVLNTWSKAPTPELLNYVYFHTEPMLEAKRGERLEFATIQIETGKKFELASSGLSRKDIKRVRARFQSKVSKLSPKQNFRFTAPRYDEEFEAAMAKLDDETTH
jgi:hypothetical protein